MEDKITMFIDQRDGEAASYILRSSGGYLAHIWPTVSIHSGKSSNFHRYDNNLNTLFVGSIVYYN